MVYTQQKSEKVKKKLTKVFYCRPFTEFRVAGCLGTTTVLVDRQTLDSDLPMSPLSVYLTPQSISNTYTSLALISLLVVYGGPTRHESGVS